MFFWNSKKKRRIELLSEGRYYAIESYLDAHYFFRYSKKYKSLYGKLAAMVHADEAETREANSTGAREGPPEIEVYYSSYKAKEFFQSMRLDDSRFKIENSFATALVRLIRDKNKDNVEVYKRASLDRKLFSKIISDHDYCPSKKTILALAIGLELNRDETQDLLSRAGFTLSDTILSDVIIGYFISEGLYDIAEINKALLAYEQKLLGSS